MFVFLQDLGHVGSSPLGINRDHAEVAGGAEAPFADERVFGVDVDAYDHGGASDVDDFGDGFDDFAGVDGGAEVDSFGGGGDDGLTAELEGGDACGFVHHAQDFAAEHGAVVVGLVGEDDVGDADFGGWAGGACWGVIVHGVLLVGGF